MDEKTLRALVDAGAIKHLRVIADGGILHICAETQNGSKFTGYSKQWR